MDGISLVKLESHHAHVQGDTFLQKKFQKFICKVISLSVAFQMSSIACTFQNPFVWLWTSLRTSTLLDIMTNGQVPSIDSYECRVGFQYPSVSNTRPFGSLGQTIES